LGISIDQIALIQRYEISYLCHPCGEQGKKVGNGCKEGTLSDGFWTNMLRGFDFRAILRVKRWLDAVLVSKEATPPYQKIELKKLNLICSGNLTKWNSAPKPSNHLGVFYGRIFSRRAASPFF